MSASSLGEPPETSTVTEAAAEHPPLRSRAEITIRIVALVLIGSLIAGWGIWEALRVLSESG
jgi:hypothetical protein